MTRIRNYVIAVLACCLLFFTPVFLSTVLKAEASATSESNFAFHENLGKTRGRNSGLEQLLDQLSNDGGSYSGGIYAPGVFAFPIISQPEDDNLYVSVKRNLVTMFSAAAANGVTGLLAHNFLAGALFYDLEIGQEIWVVESEQKLRGYQITNIDQFQKIEDDENDIFVDLETNHEMNGSEVFDRFYTGEPHLILQTCLEGEGDPSWGLTFIVAEPIP
jgi:hypothetical protein